MDINELADQKAQKAQKYNIFIEDVLKTDETGIYGYFYIDTRGNEHCFYIGKASSFFNRTFSSNGHIHQFLRFKETNGKMYSNKLVVEMINNIVKSGRKIEVRCLEIVDYSDSSFSRAAHRLAFAELKWITEYQKNDDCLNQLPDGVGKNEEDYWINKYYG